MQTKERIEKIDTIHFFDVGDLTKILYTLVWVLGEGNTIFLGVENV